MENSGDFGLSLRKALVHVYAWRCGGIFVVNALSDPNMGQCENYCEYKKPLAGFDAQRYTQIHV